MLGMENVAHAELVELKASAVKGLKELYTVLGKNSTVADALSVFLQKAVMLQGVVAKVAINCRRADLARTINGNEWMINFVNSIAYTTHRSNGGVMLMWRGQEFIRYIESPTVHDTVAEWSIGKDDMYIGGCIKGGVFYNTMSSGQLRNLLKLEVKRQIDEITKYA